MWYDVIASVIFVLCILCLLGLGYLAGFFVSYRKAVNHLLLTLTDGHAFKVNGDDKLYKVVVVDSPSEESYDFKELLPGCNHERVIIINKRALNPEAKQVVDQGRPLLEFVPTVIKAGVLSRKEFFDAHLVLFVDDNRVEVLKNRINGVTGFMKK